MNTIKELCVFQGKSKIKAGEGLKNGKYPFYTSSNEQTKFLDSYEIESEGIIMGTGGNATLHYCQGKFSVSTDCVVLRGKDNRINNKYLFYYFIKNMNVLENGFKGAGLKHTSKKYIELINIEYLPTVVIQEKIVAILDKVQLLIDKRKEQIEACDELVKSSFYEMFGDVNLNSKLWNTKRVVDVCSKILGGGTPSTKVRKYYDGNIPWVTPKDMKVDQISDAQMHISEEAVNNSSAKLIPSQSVLMVIRSGILKKYIPLAINSVPVTVNQDMKAFIVNKDYIIPKYLIWCFKGIELSLLAKVRSVTADNIEFKLIREYGIPIPPLHLQNKFAAQVEKIEQQKNLLEQSLKELENNFNALMQRAFKGELF